MKVEWKVCVDQIALGVAVRAAGVGVPAGSNWATPPTPVDGVMGVLRVVPVQAALRPFVAPCWRHCPWAGLLGRCAPRSCLRPQLEVFAVALWPWPEKK